MPGVSKVVSGVSVPGSAPKISVNSSSKAASVIGVSTVKRGLDKYKSGLVTVKVEGECHGDPREANAKGGTNHALFALNTLCSEVAEKQG